MATPEAAELSQVIRKRMQDFKALCKGVDEETASSAPSERWSPKQIVSHVSGPDGRGFLPTIQAFIEKDMPRLDIEVENPFFSERRARMTLTELLDEFEKEYTSIAEFVSDLTKEQLGRKAHIPMLKESSMGEYPTLATWIRAIGDGHLGMHTDHMREILLALGVSLKPLEA